MRRSRKVATAAVFRLRDSSLLTEAAGFLAMAEERRGSFTRDEATARESVTAGLGSLLATQLYRVKIPARALVREASRPICLASVG